MILCDGQWPLTATAATSLVLGNLGTRFGVFPPGIELGVEFEEYRPAPMDPVPKKRWPQKSLARAKYAPKRANMPSVGCVV